MASLKMPPPFIGQGEQIVCPGGSVIVEEVLMAVGEQVGHYQL